MTSPRLRSAQSARAAARDWIATTGVNLPGFRGAWLAGSVNWMAPDDVMPAWSDVDVMVLLDGIPPQKLGKLIHHGVLLEISFMAVEEVASAEAVLANYRLAASFATGRLLADRDGLLASIQITVTGEFPKPERIRARIEQATHAMTTGMAGSLNPERTFAEQVMWVFPAGIITHLLLVAALENPTVRRRYETVRTLLQRHDQLNLHERILDATGYGQLSRPVVERHWLSMTHVFDAASAIGDAPFFFASDISPAARVIAVDGTYDLIERGLHREAMFWVVATWSRALLTLRHRDQGMAPAAYEDGFAALMASLGIRESADLSQRSSRLLALVPDVLSVAHTLAGRSG